MILQKNNINLHYSIKHILFQIKIQYFFQFIFFTVPSVSSNKTPQTSSAAVFISVQQFRMHWNKYIFLIFEFISKMVYNQDGMATKTTICIIWWRDYQRSLGFVSIQTKLKIKIPDWFHNRGKGNTVSDFWSQLTI